MTIIAILLNRKQLLKLIYFQKIRTFHMRRILQTFHSFIATKRKNINSYLYCNILYSQ